MKCFSVFLVGRFARPQIQVEWKVLYIVSNEEPTCLVISAMVTSYIPRLLEEIGHTIMPGVSSFSLSTIFGSFKIPPCQQQMVERLT